MRYLHVSFTKRHDKNGLNLGGVPNFARYLARVIPELELVSFYDYPGWIETERLGEYEKALLLNGWLVDEGWVDDDTTVIADGYWGTGLENEAGRLISVCHGSYYGRFIEYQITPWGNPVNMAEVERQFTLWENPKVEVVCVAQHAFGELEMAGIVDDRFTIIPLGVDLDVFCPGDSKGNVFLHGASYRLKGMDIIKYIQQLHPEDDMALEHLDERSGDDKKKARRIRQGKALVSPSRYEGFPYLVQEFLACGVPIIAYEVGVMCDMDERVGYITDDLSPANIARLMRKFNTGAGLFDPRGWAEENCDYKAFEKKWREYLCVS